MILYRTGQSFRIDASDAKNEKARAGFAEERVRQGLDPGAVSALDWATLDYRRWWAEIQSEVRWAANEATGAYVVDVSFAYWREKCFLLTFELAEDASRFAVLFLGLDQTECEAVIAQRG